MVYILMKSVYDSDDAPKVSAFMDKTAAYDQFNQELKAADGKPGTVAREGKSLYVYGEYEVHLYEQPLAA